MLRFHSLLIFFLMASPVIAEDWPQWLGPRRDGSSVEKIAPWKGALKVLWRKPVGEGNSSPVVVAGRVFMHTKVKDKLEEQLAAFDARDGKLLWQTSYPRAALQTSYGNGPRATPAVSGKRIFTFGITGLLTCFDIADGKQVWQVDTAKKFEHPALIFGISCSPLVDGENVLLNVGGKGASVVAFAADTGNVRWQNLDDPASYSSPILIGRGKDRQAVFLTLQGLVGLNPKDGKSVWRFPFKDLVLESSTTPMQVGDILVASSITQGSVGLRLESKEGKQEAMQIWKNPQLTCYFSTPVAVGTSHFYAVVGALSLNPFKKGTKASLRCVEASTGKEIWTKPDVGTYHASLLRTGDDKLLMLEEGGDLVLIDPSPKSYRELARSKICGQTWAHPALANGRLYVRDGKDLVCVELDGRR